jgi:hypothetical protein
MQATRVLGVALLVLAAGSVALAGKINTPPIQRSSTSDDFIQCVVANVGKRAAGPFKVSIFGSSGNLATEELGLMLDTNASMRVLAGSAQLGADLSAFCRVEGKGISKNKTLVTLCTTTSSLARCEAAVSVP